MWLKRGEEMNTRERNRNRRERRILTARKIRHRAELRRCCIDCDYVIERGRLDKRLIYRPKNWWEYYKVPSVTTQRNLDMMNTRMEDYYNETVCEL